MVFTQQHNQGDGPHHLSKADHTAATREATRTGRGLMPAGMNLEAVWFRPPEAGTSPGIPGMRAYDEDNVYLCIAADTWKQIPLEDWVV